MLDVCFLVVWIEEKNDRERRRRGRGRKVVLEWIVDRGRGRKEEMNKRKKLIRHV